MVTFQTVGKPAPPGPGLGPAAPGLARLRELCFSLLADVPASDRKAMLQRLDKMRRADDVRHLRSALFDTIARIHGEGIARERLATLDAQLPP